MKLKVNFTYDETSKEAGSHSGGSGEGSSANAEALRSKLLRDPSNSTALTNEGGEPGEDDAVHEPGSKEALAAELTGLRKRYDAVVVYTVHLTAERDAIIAQLETAQKDLVKEKAKAKKGADSSQKDRNGLDKVPQKSEVSKYRSSWTSLKLVLDLSLSWYAIFWSQSGFGLISVFLAALIFFLLGKYFA